MDILSFKRPGATVRVDTGSSSFTAQRTQGGGVATVVSHTPIDAANITIETSGLRVSYPELSWLDFYNYAIENQGNMEKLNVSLVFWDTGERPSDSMYAIVPFDSRECVLPSGLVSVDSETKTFTVTNELNRLGEGVSGGVVLMELDGIVYSVGQINSLVNGNLGDTHELRCVCSESITQEFPNDRPLMHNQKKNSNGNTSEKHQKGIKNDTTNKKSAEKRASKSTADKNRFKQREQKEKLKEEKDASRQLRNTSKTGKKNKTNKPVK